jgi:nitric oxide dioxygenase
LFAAVLLLSPAPTIAPGTIKRMTPNQLRLLQQSFNKIEPELDRFGAIFYDRLFAIAPEMRSLFRNDLKAQQAKFMKVIGEVVQLHLRAMISLPATSQVSSEAMLPGAFWSGRVHAAYGVRIEDFESMKAALIWALNEMLRDQSTPETRQAWSIAYDIVARAMQRGMTSAEDKDAETRMDLQTRAVDGGSGNHDHEATAFLRMLDGRF